MHEEVEFETWYHVINDQRDFLDEKLPNVDYQKIMAQINTLKIENQLSEEEMDLVIEGYRVFHLKKLPK